jgi:hypothetical protein
LTTIIEVFAGLYPSSTYTFLEAIPSSFVLDVTSYYLFDTFLAETKKEGRKEGK